MSQFSNRPVRMKKQSTIIDAQEIRFPKYGIVGVLRWIIFYGVFFGILLWRSIEGEAWAANLFEVLSFMVCGLHVICLFDDETHLQAYLRGRSVPALLSCSIGFVYALFSFGLGWFWVGFFWVLTEATEYCIFAEPPSSASR